MLWSDQRFGVLDVAHRCLDNTERSLLTHFIDLESGIGYQGRVGSTLARHQRAHTLLAEMENCFRGGRQDEFVSTSRRYTLVMADLIFHETEFLPALLAPHTQDRGFQQMMEEFDRVDTDLAAAARKASQTMHRLESKYVSPHCI